MPMTLLSWYCFTVVFNLKHNCEDYADEYDVSFKCHDCHAKNCFITIHNAPLLNIDKAVRLCNSFTIDRFGIHS